MCSLTHLSLSLASPLKISLKLQRFFLSLAKKPISTLSLSLSRFQPHSMPDNGDLYPRFCKFFLSQTDSESLMIPLHYMEFLADPLPKTVKLQGTGGGSWTVSLKKICGAVYFTSGWPEFVEDHELKNGEFMTFVYDGHRTFEVSVFDCSTCKVTRAEIQAIQLSDSVVEDEEDSTDVDDDDGSFGEDEEINHDEETETDAAVIGGKVDVEALTNPSFQFIIKNQIYELLIPANVVNENNLKFGESIKYIEGEGSLVGLRAKWSDKRVSFKGWSRICRRNKLKKLQDTVQCELLHDDQKMVHSIRVHVLRRTA